MENICDIDMSTLETDLDNLKTLDKNKAIVVCMHLLDAASLLTADNASLSLLLANLANIIQQNVDFSDDDMSECQNEISELQNVENEIRRVKEK